MREIGLQPSTMGQPGGRETGQTVSHYIVPGGQFARAYQKLEGTGFQLRWQSRTESDGTVRKSKRASKTKFTCPECGQNAWGKPDSLLICGECYENGDADVCYLLGEPDDE